MTSDRSSSPHIELSDVSIGYGDFIIQRNLTFTISRQSVFVIMGGSGCGKSTLLRNLMGLQRPLRGAIKIDGEDLWSEREEISEHIMRKFGVLYQQGALWSALTLAENVALPLETYSRLDAASIREVVRFKLALVGLEKFADFYPSEISGGMRKQAALARSIALDPEVLLLDEPSAGLDPISSVRLDDLILELQQSLKTTIVVVTHELASIFKIASDCVFLDSETRTAIAHGDPKILRENCEVAKVREFLNRGEGA